MWRHRAQTTTQPKPDVRSLSEPDFDPVRAGLPGRVGHLRVLAGRLGPWHHPVRRLVVPRDSAHPGRRRHLDLSEPATHHLLSRDRVDRG